MCSPRNFLVVPSIEQYAPAAFSEIGFQRRKLELRNDQRRRCIHKQSACQLLSERQLLRIFPAKSYKKSNNGNGSGGIGEGSAIIHRKSEKKVEGLSQSCEKSRVASEQLLKSIRQHALRIHACACGIFYDSLEPVVNSAKNRTLRTLIVRTCPPATDCGLRTEFATGFRSVDI
jgi:hypothetical protein